MKISKAVRSYYQTLGVNQNATVLEIEAAWQKKKRDYSARDLQNLGETSMRLVQSETEQIKEAYSVLIDPQTREEYNRWLAGRKTSARKRTRFTTSKRFMNKQAKIDNDRAIECWEQNRHDEAIVQWEAAASKDPDIAELHHNLGNAYSCQNQPEKAIESLKLAISIDPTLVEAYNKLGCVFYRQGNRNSALKSWKQALKVNPDFKEAVHNLRVLQNATQFDIDSEIPIYQRDKATQDDGDASWKIRVRRRFEQLLGKLRETDSQ